MLSRKAKQDFSQYTATSEKNVGELKQLVAKLPYLQAAKLSLATRESLPSSSLSVLWSNSDVILVSTLDYRCENGRLSGVRKMCDNI